MSYGLRVASSGRTELVEGRKYKVRITNVEGEVGSKKLWVMSCGLPPAAGLSLFKAGIIGESGKWKVESSRLKLSLYVMLNLIDSVESAISASQTNYERRRTRLEIEIIIVRHAVPIAIGMIQHLK